MLSSGGNESSKSDASDYRGSSKYSTIKSTDGNSKNCSQSTDSNSTNCNQSISQQKKMSFSNIVKASSFPKKEQAIIFPVIEGLQVKDYVIATGNVVDPKEILFASRISNNRICINFSSKLVVNNFIENHNGIQINDVFVPARKLILPAKRLILSNVSPCIPHTVIEDELRESGIKLVSPMSFIGAGIGLDKFRHICSFRRQVFVATDQAVEIPSSILITFEDEEYRVFLSDDKLRCFKCKEEGHIAANCTVSPDVIEIPIASNKRPPPSVTDTSDATSMEVQTSYQNVSEGDLINLQESQKSV